MNKFSDNTIDRVLNGIASKEEAAEVAKWFATDDGQVYLLQRMTKESNMQKEFFEDFCIDNNIPSEEIFDVINKRIRHKKTRHLLYYAAAIMLPFILVFSAILKINTQVDLFGKSEYKEIYVPKGERIQVVFQDGTKAYLNSDSRLRYPEKFGLTNRKVYLEGEAYFVVKKNPDRPFLVQMDSATIQVLGTSFNVEAYSSEKDICITLDEGNVNLSPRSNDRKYKLKPGERLVYDKYNGACTIMSKDRDGSALLWKDNIIAFKDKPFEDVMKVLNRWYNVDFVLEDREVLQFSYTITMSKNTSLPQILSDLEKIAPVKFLYKDNKVTVSLVKSK